MVDRVQDICERAFASQIQQLFDHAPHIPGTGMLAEIPVVGGRFLQGFPIPSLLQRVCKALIARERFRQDAPTWPSLPLHEDAREMLANDDDPRLNILGYYANSLAAETWNYEAHPRIGAFAAGLMAYEHTPDEIRNDCSLQQEFPPRPLEGLCDGQLVWRSSDTLAEDRDMLVRIAAYEAEMRA